MIRQLIREMLLNEEVYGAQAVVYHGSKAPPDVFVPALLNDTFEPGMGDGAMYGKALYCVYDLGGTKTEKGDYGKYIYKFKVNLYGFICFDPEVAQLVYKRPLTPVEQAQELGLDKTLIKQLKRIRTEGLRYTSDSALPASKFLKGRVKGLIFTGSRDGRVAVVYDQTVAVPFSWKSVRSKKWNHIDKSSLKPALRRSASGDWEAEKYDVDPVALLARLSKLPVDMRVVKDHIELVDTDITSLPAGLQVGGDLYLKGTSITSLPAGLQIGRDLYLMDTKITSLPADLKVGGSLTLRKSKITSLPAGLQVGGDLYLTYVAITSLPAGLRVGGNLYLMYTEITSLPAGLKVGGWLSLNNSNIASLPADLQVSGYIYGFLGDKSQVPQHLKDKV